MYFDAIFLDKLLYFYTSTRYTMTIIGRDNLCIGFGTALRQKRNPSKKKGITKMIIKNYRDNKELRQSFNELARQTFDIDFEDWYQNGFWSDSDRLLLHNIFAPHPVDIMQIVNDWGGNIRQVILGFTPQNHGALTLALRKEEDCTLFLKGSGFERFETDRLMFPALSHA